MNCLRASCSQHHVLSTVMFLSKHSQWMFQSCGTWSVMNSSISPFSTLEDACRQCDHQMIVIWYSVRSVFALEYAIQGFSKWDYVWVLRAQIRVQGAYEVSGYGPQVSAVIMFKSAHKVCDRKQDMRVRTRFVSADVIWELGWCMKTRKGCISADEIWVLGWCMKVWARFEVDDEIWRLGWEMRAQSSCESADRIYGFLIS